MQSKAAVLRNTAEPLSIESIEVALPKDQEVLVEIKATSVCRSDLNGSRDVHSPKPMVLGHEGAGIVRHVGTGVDHVAPGDHVILSWIPSCGQCFFCVSKQEYLCSVVEAPFAKGTLLDGTTRFSSHDEPVHHYSLLSTFSQYTVVPMKSCVKIPADVPFEYACLIGCGVATGFGAVVRASDIKKGESMVIFGAGGVGVASILGGVYRRAKTILVVDHKEANLAEARKCGATHTALASDKAGLSDLTRELTQGLGLDYAFDTTGQVKASRTAFDLIRKGGNLVIVGAFHQDELSFPAQGFHQNGKSIKSSFYGNIDPKNDLRWIAELSQQGKLDLSPLVREKIGLEDINKVFEKFDDPLSSNFGRSVIML